MKMLKRDSFQRISNFSRFWKLKDFLQPGPFSEIFEEEPEQASTRLKFFELWAYKGEQP